MYAKSILTVLLLTTFLGAQSSPSPAQSSPVSPVIIKKLSLKNQTAPIPQTSIFTPPATGLYRLSVYMIETVPVVGGSDSWGFNLLWTDDAGVLWQDTVIEQQDWGGISSGAAFPPGGVGVFQAVAGQPVSYSVTGPAAGTGGTYELFFVVERLM
jgi:hypothetical protein